ncbi:hypothetical protein WKH56_10345 [Priestia sp. SB1]|uniref:Uncharacterized protein n=1 Tax=Priestia aryabhattai TaxID=412384 RepID=A0AAX6NCM9_PRIAR|nr:hypothetical protein [Priestia aryabhattai]MDU9693648.1 hypothetical protein [Priestia aryabhattai]
MKKRNGIYIYSAYPIVDVGTYFSERAIKPITFNKKIDPTTLLPVSGGFPKSYLLKVEHELSLKSEVHLFSSFLSELDIEPFRELATKYNADITFVHFNVYFDNLYEFFKKKGGELPYSKFSNAYLDAFHLPYEGIKKGILYELF